MTTAARIAFLALLAPMTGWAQKIDVSNYSITCNTLTGTATNDPPLVIGGTASPRTTTVRASIAGCSVTGPSPVTIVSGKVTGKVTAATNECVTLFEPLDGTLTIKWTADPSTPILQRSTTMQITDVTFGGFGAPWGTSYGQFSLGVTNVTGAFTGGDNGAQSTNVTITGQDIVQILTECGSPHGLETLYLGLGTMTLK